MSEDGIELLRQAHRAARSPSHPRHWARRWLPRRLHRRPQRLNPPARTPVPHYLVDTGAIATSTLEPDGTQEEFVLGFLLGHAKLTEILGADLVFDLRDLLSERA